MRWLCLILCFAVVGNLQARPGVVRTLDGRTLAGDLQFTNGLLLVSGTNAESATVALTNLVSAKFGDGGGATSGAAPGHGNGLIGHYFGNTNLAGNVVIRLDETIDFEWGAAEPVPGVTSDFFSVAWTGEVEAPTTGEFTFVIAADDNAQLTLEDKVIVETRDRRDGTEVAGAPIPMEAGKKYRLKYTYYDANGTARARLLWSGPGVSKSVIPKERLYAKSLLPDHASDISTNQGLLATYYRDAEFGGGTFTRVDPEIDFNWTDRDPASGFSRTNVSIRWSGQVLANHTEEYIFYTLSDERVRLWIDRKLLIDRPEQAWLMENKEGIALVAGERYDIRIETQSHSGGAVAKLMWSSASLARTNVSSTNLFPSRPTLTRDAAIDSGEKMPAGLLLRNGAFVGCVVEKATETSIRTAGLLKNTPVSTVNVARILCQPMSKAMEARIVPGRPGVLLSKGDFVDGDFRGLENGRVKVSSILFGLRTYDAKKEVLAVSLHDTAGPAVSFEIRLQDQTLVHSGNIRFERDQLTVQEAALGVVRIPPGEVAEIRRRVAGALTR